MMRRRVRILVVDDEVEIVRALQRSLIGHGYEVLITGTGESALEVIEQQSLDLVLLDLGLPGMSGLEVCKQVRSQSELPIIVISVKNKERDKVLALDLGADDYISKPFGINEVLARIRVALRHAERMMPKTEPKLVIEPLEIDFAQRLVKVNGQEVKLTPTEYDLLRVFVLNSGKIMTQQMLLSQVWGSKQDAKSHYLHVYIAQLRRKIEPDPEHPRLLTTISGVGYRFNDGG
ncbi:MAG: response regulator transcription factor [Chloroflexi bacterium]|jgi:two-component system KDP operon response regulator KdpE|nr:MAG: response regulator transcription factor [Chloroflexota bacterium]